jgi:hypothetical protein
LAPTGYKLSTKTNGPGTVLVYNGSSFALTSNASGGDVWQSVPEANYVRICAAWRPDVCIAAGAGTAISQLVLSPKSADWKQAWELTPNGDGYYTIRNIGTGAFLPDAWMMTAGSFILAGPPITYPTTVYGDVRFNSVQLEAPPPAVDYDSSPQAAIVERFLACSGGEIIKDFCLEQGTAPSRSYLRDLERLAIALAPSGTGAAVRATLFGLILQIAQKFPYQWTPDEKGIMNWLAAKVRESRLAVAEKTLEEYRRWKTDPWSYQPPAGYGFDAYLIPHPGHVAWMFNQPKPPLLWYQSVDSFLSELFFGTVTSSGMGPLLAGLPSAGAGPVAFPAYAQALVNGAVLGSDEGRHTRIEFQIRLLQTVLLYTQAGGPIVTAAILDRNLFQQLEAHKPTGLVAKTLLNVAPYCGRKVTEMAESKVVLIPAGQQQYARPGMSDQEIKQLTPPTKSQVRNARLPLDKLLRIRAGYMGGATTVLSIAVSVAANQAFNLFSQPDLERVVQEEINRIKASPYPDIRRLVTGQKLSNCTATGCTVTTEVIPEGVQLTPEQYEIYGGPEEVMNAFLRATTDLADRSVPAANELWTASGARDIGINSEDNVWVIGRDPRGEEGNYGVWYYNPSEKIWRSAPGYGVAIAGDGIAGNVAWVVRADGKLMIQDPGAARDMNDYTPTDYTKDVASGKNVRWKIGSRRMGNDWAILSCCGWTETQPGTTAAASRIGVGLNDDPYVVNSRNEIYWYSRAQNRWSRLPGEANDIGAGADGTVWVIGNTAADSGGNYRIYRWDAGAGTWRAHPNGKGVRIAVDRSGNPWVVQADGKVVQYNRQ